MGRTLIEIINQIESDKRGRGISPTHATIGEVLKIDPTKKEEINSMVEHKQISLGHTINDQFIKVL